MATETRLSLGVGSTPMRRSHSLRRDSLNSIPEDSDDILSSAPSSMYNTTFPPRRASGSRPLTPRDSTRAVFGPRLTHNSPFTRSLPNLPDLCVNSSPASSSSSSVATLSSLSSSSREDGLAPFSSPSPSPTSSPNISLNRRAKRRSWGGPETENSLSSLGSFGSSSSLSPFVRLPGLRRSKGLANFADCAEEDDYLIHDIIEEEESEEDEARSSLNLHSSEGQVLYVLEAQTQSAPRIPAKRPSSHSSSALCSSPSSMPTASQEIASARRSLASQSSPSLPSPSSSSSSSSSTSSSRPAVLPPLKPNGPTHRSSPLSKAMTVVPPIHSGTAKPDSAFSR